jgi:uncharacterized coiled-coil protein SlyX
MQQTVNHDEIVTEMSARIEELSKELEQARQVVSLLRCALERFTENYAKRQMQVMTDKPNGESKRV